MRMFFERVIGDLTRVLHASSARDGCARVAWTVAAGALLAACGSGGRAGDTSAAASAGVAVGTTVAALTVLDVTLRETGTVIARPGGFATVSAPAPARVTRIYVEPGQRVTRGAPLVAMEAGPFTAVLREAQAAQRAASLAAERARRLAGQGIVPRREVEHSSAALAQADAALSIARRNAELAMLRAPIAGVVARLGAVLNATADPSQPLVEVVDPGALQVRVLVPPADAAALRPGMSVVFSGSDGAQVGVGTVTTIAPSVDSLSRAVEVRARVASPARVLRVGESITASMRIGGGASVLAVPTGALVPDADGYRVFVVARGDTARARQVTVGRRTAQMVEITRGLRAGETVVTVGAYGLEDGVRVARRGDATVPAGAVAPGRRP